MIPRGPPVTPNRYKLEAANEMLREICQECDRLWREYSELAHKSFRFEERLRRAELCQDHDQVKVVAARLAHLAGEQTRLRQALVEHEAQAHRAPQGVAGIPH